MNDLKKFKILLLNLGYCTKLDGSMKDYFTKFYRYPFLPEKIEDEVLSELKAIIKTENPDLICLTEIKQGKQIRTLLSESYAFHDIAVKYGENSFLRKLPPFKSKGNAVISKKKLSCKKHYLENGTKKLLLEVELPNRTSLFFMHFSLSKKIRAKQFQEIQQKFGKVKSKIICGDFNVYGGLTELSSLMEKSQLKFTSKQATFPSFKPQKALDLFLVPNDLKFEIKVLGNKLSDHLPITMTIETS